MIQIKELSEFQLANNFIFRVFYIFDTFIHIRTRVRAYVCAMDSLDVILYAITFWSSDAVAL